MESQPRFDRLVRENWNNVLDVATQALHVKDIDPNIVTACGGAMGILSAYAISRGNFPLARGLFLAAGLADSVDGYLARSQGKTSRFGAFFDSVLDRGVDAATMWGMQQYAESQGWDTVSALTQVARPLVVGPSLLRMVGESHDIKCPEQGYGSRMARSAVTATCLMYPDEKVWTAGIGYIAAASGITTAQRIGSIHGDEDAVRQMWEAFDTWGSQRLVGDATTADVGLVAQYTAGKVKLVTGEIHPSPDPLLSMTERSVWSTLGGQTVQHMFAAQDLLTYAQEMYDAFQQVCGS